MNIALDVSLQMFSNVCLCFRFHFLFFNSKVTTLCLRSLTPSSTAEQGAVCRQGHFSTRKGSQPQWPATTFSEPSVATQKKKRTKNIIMFKPTYCFCLVLCLKLRLCSGFSVATLCLQLKISWLSDLQAKKKKEKMFKHCSVCGKSTSISLDQWGEKQ